MLLFLYFTIQEIHKDTVLVVCWTAIYIGIVSVAIIVIIIISVDGSLWVITAFILSCAQPYIDRVSFNKGAVKKGVFIRALLKRASVK